MDGREVTTAWLDVARRRLEELHSGKVQAIPGEQVFENIVSRHWAREAADRLAAFKRGELAAVSEDDVFGDLDGQ